MRKRRGGFSIVEVVVAMSLLAVVALSVMPVFSSSIRLDNLNRERMWVRQTCRQQVEAILATPFSQVKTLYNSSPLSSFDVGFDVNGVTGAEKLLAPPSGSAKVGSITVDDTTSGDASCLKVTITARWRSSAGFGGTAAGDTITVVYVFNVADH